MPGAPITAIGTQRAPGVIHFGSLAETRTFTRRPEEVPAARRFVRDALRDHPGSMDAELLACELITNAIQHAADASAITVVVVRHGEQGQYVHVDVIDDGHTGLPHWREAGRSDESGRGFQLVNEIAHRWGFVRENAGTCVWFEIASLDRGSGTPPRRARPRPASTGGQDRFAGGENQPREGGAQYTFC